jgi:hypothetical protein
MLGSMKGGDMRRGFGAGMVILLILIAVGVGIGAYNWGLTQGLEESGQAVEVVHYHGPGFFPFGFILFPLFIFGFFALMRGAFWGHHRGGYGHGGGHGKLEDYHRELHEREAKGGTTGETGSA